MNNNFHNITHSHSIHLLLRLTKILNEAYEILILIYKLLVINLNLIIDLFSDLAFLLWSVTHPDVCSESFITLLLKKESMWIDYLATQNLPAKKSDLLLRIFSYSLALKCIFYY